jgi:hypothetical protein
MSELLSFDVAQKQGRYDCPTTVANASADIPADIEPQLNCSLANSAAPAGSSNAPFWNTVWKGTGACTGFPPSQYFRLFAEKYNLYNPNVRRWIFSTFSKKNERLRFVNETLMLFIFLFPTAGCYDC